MGSKGCILIYYNFHVSYFCLLLDLCTSRVNIGGVCTLGLLITESYALKLIFIECHVIRVCPVINFFQILKLCGIFFAGDGMENSGIISESELCWWYLW